MFNELIEQIGGRERLEFIAENAISRERIIMARALLAVLEAQAIGWVDSEEMRAIDKNRHATIYKIEPDNPYHDPRRQKLVYLAPPAASVPDGLAAAVNRLLDSDGSRGTFSAIRRSDALAEVERLLAAAPATGVPDALREAVNAIYFTDSSDYFSALWSIVRFLSPETADLLAKDERAAFERVNANLQHAAAPAPGGDGG